MPTSTKVYRNLDSRRYTKQDGTMVLANGQKLSKRDIPMVMMPPVTAQNHKRDNNP